MGLTCGFELQGFTTIKCYAIIPSRIIDTDLNNKDLSFNWRHLLWMVFTEGF